MLVVAFLSLQLTPYCSFEAHKLLTDSRRAMESQAIVGGRFNKQRFGSLITYAQTISSDGLMDNVFVAEWKKNKNNRQMIVTYADEGEIVFDSTVDRYYFELRNGTRYSGVPGAIDYEAVAFTRYRELIPENSSSIRASVKSSAIPTMELIANDTPENKSILYWRLSLPLLVPVLTLIAVALSGTDSRRDHYIRLGPAIILCVLYFIALIQSRSFIEAGGSVLPLCMTHIGFALLGVFMLQWESLSKQLKIKRV